MSCKKRISKRTVDAAEPSDKEFFVWDTDLKGFGLRVSPSGRKTFFVQYRLAGRGSQARREAIGTFGPITPDQARAMARAILARVETGVDPVADRAAEAEAAKRHVELGEALRFDRLAERFMSEHVATKRKSKTESFYRLVLDKHVLPRLGKLDARKITPAEVEALHVTLRSTPTMANRAMAVVGAVYGWADRLAILPEGTRNPTRRIELYKERGRDRFLTVEELARLGEAIRIAEREGIPWQPDAKGKVKHAPKPENRLVKIDSGAAAALRLLLFTGARLREILHLEWAAVDLERGLLRLRDSKTGPKIVVLNAPARAVLAGLPRIGRFVIPGSGIGPEEKPKADLKRPWSMVCRAAGLKGVRIHDLRHSFASVGAGDGHGLTIVGKLLGHAQARTTERYAHLDADPLRRASDAIATRIAAAMGEAAPFPTADVVPLRAVR